MPVTSRPPDRRNEGADYDERDVEKRLHDDSFTETFEPVEILTVVNLVCADHVHNSQSRVDNHRQQDSYSGVPESCFSFKKHDRWCYDQNKENDLQRGKSKKIQVAELSIVVSKYGDLLPDRHSWSRRV